MNINAGNNTRLAVCISILIITFTVILDRLMPEGIFIDGVTYASISRNLAVGKGSFWSLYYRGGLRFSEHPPLMFGLQAIFFKLLGDHYLTEKIYCFFTWLITAVLIKKLWNTNSNTTKYSYALPLLMWCLIPTITWGYTNNILDCTMAIFDVAAVLLIYKGISNSRNKLLLLISGALLIVAAVLTKGPVGTFPLVVPFVYWLTYQKSLRQFSTALWHTLLLLLIIVATFFILYQFPASRHNLSEYIENQLFAALNGNREVTGGSLGRFAVVFDLLVQLILPVAIALVVFVISKISKTSPEKSPEKNKRALFFLLIGLLGSLPIILSVKQRTFYLVPALPYFVLAIATIVYPYYNAITNRWQIGSKSIKYFKISAAVISLVLCVYLCSKVGHIGRSHQLINTMSYLSTKFPTGQVIGICPENDYDYEFLAYLQRYHEMEVDPATYYYCEYVLVDKNMCNSDFINIITKIGYHQQEFNCPPYELYKRPQFFPIRFNLLNPAFPTGGK